MIFSFKDKGKKIKKRDELEVQEIFLDKFSEDKIEVPLVKRKIYFFFGISAILLILLLVETFSLQIIQHRSFFAKAERNKAGIYLVRPLRGIIYDENFNQLVTNKKVFDLICEKNILPRSLEEKEEVIVRISEILEEKPEEIFEKFNSTLQERVLIFENLPHEKLIKISSQIEKLPGFKIEESVIRNYDSGFDFSHLLGYVNKVSKEELQNFEDYDVSDIIGRTGLEKFYEKILRGKVGRLRIERDALGKEINRKIIQEPEFGNNIVLNLNSEFQKKVIEILRTTLKNYDTQKAAVVALDVKTGGILSLVSFPSYDNNLFSQKESLKEIEKLFKDPNSPLLNRVISGQYLTGSTIKPFIAISALEEKIITEKTKINCQGFIKIPNPWGGEPSIFRDWEKHGVTDIKKAITQSCNVYFYTIGGGYENFKGLGAEKIKKYLKLFGFEKKLNIDLPNEKSGFVPDPKWKKENLKDDWRVGDTYNLSIGQGFIKVTPLQIAAATAAIVNEGNLLKPRVVKKIVDFKKNIIQEIQPEIIKELPFEKEYFKLVKEGMRGAVISGTAHLLNSLSVKVAAKTGTAQTGKEGIYHYWITTFFPYENPEIVLTVLVENSIEKELTPANFIAKQILEWYFAQPSSIYSGFTN